ncbi:MAG: hypothetical protein GY705_22580 [Bacteroidetes bacterium]|nr:hypothetical protein [Bacteroidota bacterium]
MLLKFKKWSKTESRGNLWTWLFLMLLTIINGFFANQSMGRIMIISLGIFTSIKVLLVCYQYMELKKAHKAWMFIILGILFVYSTAVIYFYA